MLASPFVLARLGAGLALAMLVSDPHGDGRRYFRIAYDYEVAAQCGLVSEAVERGYRANLAAAGDASGLDDEALRQLRIRAIVAAAQEYDNRGLGGYRAWCADEGRAGVERLTKEHP